MADAKTLLSMDQEAQVGFLQAVGPLRQLTAVTPLATAPRVVDALTAVTLAFGACELRMRRSERLTELGLFEDEASALAESAREHNQRGLHAIPAVRELAEELGRQEPDGEPQGEWAEAGEFSRRSWRYHVSEMDVDRSEASKLSKLMDDCCDAVDRGGPRGLGEYLGSQIDELQRVRMSPDRGTHSTNPAFPWWKIVAAAAWIGVTVATVVRAIEGDAAWYEFAVIAVIAIIAGVLVAVGC
jgi:hypothetical protein